jgi:hypothetical protein
MKCARCKEEVKGGLFKHLYHIWRHYKWWGDAIYD